MRGGLFFCSAIAIGAVVGCSRSESETVFARIDGWPLTVSYVSNRVMLAAQANDIRRRLKDPKQFVHWANDKAMGMIPSLLSERLIGRELGKMGISPTREDFDLTLASYRRDKELKNADLAELAERFGELKDVFLEKVRNEARFQAYVRIKQICEVSDAELNGQIAKLKFQKSRTDERNARARARGKSAWRELKAGAPWDEVSRKYSEDRLIDEQAADYVREWGEFDPEGSGFPELDECLPKMKKGEYSEPLETDDGLLIVRVNDILESGAYLLSRIMIRLLYDVEVPSEKEVRKSLYAEKFKAAQLELVKSLREKAKIEYPLGETFSYKIWDDGSLADNQPGSRQRKLRLLK